MYEIDACRLCRNQDLKVVLDLGTMELTGTAVALDVVGGHGAPRVCARCKLL